MDVVREAEPLSSLSLSALPLGASRLGGVPDLPAGTEWPSHAGVPLTFLLQVRLEDAHAAMAGARRADGRPFPPLPAELPRRGWLVYFHLLCDNEVFKPLRSADADWWGKGRHAGQLLWWDDATASASQLQRTRHPADGALRPEELAEFGTGLAPYRVRLVPALTLPDLDERWRLPLSEAQRNAVVALQESAEQEGGVMSLEPHAAWRERIAGGTMRLCGWPLERGGSPLCDEAEAGADATGGALAATTTDAAARDATASEVAAAAARRSQLVVQVASDSGVAAWWHSPGRRQRDVTERPVQRDAFVVGEYGTIWAAMTRTQLAARRFDEASTLFAR